LGIRRPDAELGLKETMWRRPRRARGAGRLPTFVIGGMPKCGTTALAAHLQHHPDAFIAPQKEVHFFDKQFDRGVDWYKSQFADARDERALGDATPTYLVKDAVAERMAALLPDAKVILILRNPVDRVISHYWWMRGAVGFERRDFADAMKAELNDPEGTSTKPHFWYLAGGCYGTYLERLGRYYPREATTVVLAEDLRHDARAAFAATCRFLGISDEFEPAGLGSNINGAFMRRSEKLHAAMLRTKAWNWLPGAHRIDLANRKLLPYAPVDEGLRAELMEWYKPHTDAVSRFLSRDVGAIWTA
jgi:Sulfotransferase domain